MAAVAFLLCHFCFFFVSLAVVWAGNEIFYDATRGYYQINLPKVAGPESIAFDCEGQGPYVSVSDGRIIKWQGSSLGWAEFAVSSSNRNRKLCDGSTDPALEPTCGRPLGIKFSPVTCDLYIADAYFGLQVVGPHGGVAKQLATSAEGVPFRFLNALDIDPNTGVVYFTDTSIYFQRWQYPLALLYADKSGRFMKYDPQTKAVNVLSRGLAFPNGVALSKDNSFVLVAESETQKILKFSLVGSSVSGPEVFAQLYRVPDNIKRNDNGEFWVALNSGRGRLQGLNNTNLQDEHVFRWLKGDPVGVKLGEDGKTVTVLDARGAKALDSVSEVEERNGFLWLGSAVQPYLCRIKNY